MDNIIDVGRLWQIIKRNVLLMTLLGLLLEALPMGLRRMSCSHNIGRRWHC